MNEKRPVYSVIIPHFNDSVRLERLLCSVPVERLDVEVVVVDDCSPDQEALEAVRLRWPQILWLSTSKNAGAGVARNIGLQAVEGRWLLFADSDDEFLPGAFETFDKVLLENDQLVYFLAEAVREVDGSPSMRSYNMNNLVEAYAVGKDERSLQCLRLHHVVPWAKVYARSFVDKNLLRFDLVRHGNDVAFNVLAAVQVKLPRTELIPVYRVYRRGGSLTSDASAHIFMERFLVNRSVAQRLALMGVVCTRPVTGQMLMSFRYGPCIALRVWWLAVRSPMQIEWSRIFDLGRWRQFLASQCREVRERQE